MRIDAGLIMSYEQLNRIDFSLFICVVRQKMSIFANEIMSS